MQIKASPGADDLARSTGRDCGGRRLTLLTPSSSFSGLAHVWAVRKDRPQVTHGGIETDMGALRHDLYRAVSADARHGGAEHRGTEERMTRTGGGQLARRRRTSQQRVRRTSQRHHQQTQLLL